MSFTKSNLSFLSKVFIALFVVILFSTSSNAQELNFTGSWGPAGMTLTRSASNGVEVNYSLNNVVLSDVLVDGVTMKAATVPGIFLPNDPGMPDLAGTGRYLAIPQGSTVSYKIISFRTEVIKNIEIAPAPVLPLDNDPTPLKYSKNMSIYSKNALYPENIIKISNVTSIRGVDAVVLGITPFQYNPATKELIIYRDVKVQVDFVGGNGRFGDASFRSRFWEPILSDVLLNYSTLPVIDFDKQYTDKNLETGYEYVIIRPNSAVFAPWADTLKKFRTEQGIKTAIFTLAEVGGNTVAGIKAWVNNAYNTWTIKPAAICLMGDYSTDASGNTGIISILQTHPAGYPAFASDNYYSDVNGDEMPEIVFSRIIGNDATQLQTLISKNLNYERNPPTDPNFYLKPITALGWQTERWFQICSEVLGGFFKKIYNKLPQRINKIYSGTPGTQWSTATNTATVVNYFGTVGLGYIPMTPDSLGSWDGGTAAMVNNAINAGSFLLQHRDHGLYTGWGEPAYSTSNISSLTNTGTLLPFIYSINCQTGAYHNPSGCPAEGSFVEMFYRYKYNNQNSGALGLVCPSEVSYSFVNDTYCWGMYDNMWPNFMPAYGTTPPSRDVKPAFGMAAGKYFLQQSSWPYNTSDKLVTYRLFHMHGDAFLNLYYQVPQNLTMTIPATVFSGQTTVSITAPVGAFVALTLNGEILGTATGTGSSQTITIPGTQLPTQQIKVVATKQNYFRYENSINVIPPSGPYVVYHNTTINDLAPLGNGNGLMDYGETNKLNLKVKNVGVNAATSVNVKVSSTDPYVTLTDSTEVYGTVNAGDSVLVNNAFTYTVSNNIPEGRVVNFNLTATSGSNVWTSGFSITAHAPILKYDGFTVIDSTGNNNNRWDPGETVKLKVKAKNAGTSAVNNVVGVITKNSSFVTINTNNQSYGNINGLDSAFRYFNVTAAANTPAGHVCKFTITYTGNLGVTVLDSFSATIGNNICQIGNGTTSIGYPYYTYYMDSRTDMLYLASEIMTSGVSAPGLVTKIGFDVTSAASQEMSGFTIKMQNYSGSSIAGWTSTGWSTVYSGTYTVPGSGWQMVTLQTPFLWNGTSNLLIEICFDNTSYTSNTTINGFTPYAGLVYHNHVDNGTGCSLTSSSAVTARANIKLEINAATGISNLNTGIPTRFELAQNYPNPFNPVTKINFAIPKQSVVSLKVYDVLGREVATLVNETKQPAYYSIDFDASVLSSGVYFYKLIAGDFVEVKRMVLLK